MADDDKGEGRTTAAAARKRNAAWRDDPQAQLPADHEDRSSEADEFKEEE